MDLLRVMVNNTFGHRMGIEPKYRNFIKTLSEQNFCKTHKNEEVKYLKEIK